MVASPSHVLTSSLQLVSKHVGEINDEDKSRSGSSRNVGDLAVVLRTVLRDEGLAKQESVDKLGAVLQAHEERLSAAGASIREFRTTLADLRAELAGLRLERAGAPATNLAAPEASPSQPSHTAAAPPAGWKPRSVLVRGFAPFGCPPAQKLTKEQYNVESRELLESSPTPIRGLVRLQTPFVLSH